MSEIVWVQGRIEAPDEASARAIAERLCLPFEVRGAMLAVRTDGSMSYGDFDELFATLNELGGRSRIGFVRGSIGPEEEDASWSTAEAVGDRSLSVGAQLSANRVYALDWEELEVHRVDAAVARELIAVYPSLPDAESKALLVTSIYPHYGDAREVLLDVLRLGPGDERDDTVWVAKSCVLAYLDGDPDGDREYFDLPRDELDRIARARAASG